MSISGCNNKMASCVAEPVSVTRTTRLPQTTHQTDNESGFVLAEANVYKGMRECQFITPIPATIIANGEPVLNGQRMYLGGQYITSVNILFDGQPVEIGARAEGWKQSEEVFLSDCSLRVNHMPIKPYLGFNDCERMFVSDQRETKGVIFGGGDRKIEVHDTIVALYEFKTPREVDVEVTTEGAWSVQKRL